MAAHSSFKHKPAALLRFQVIKHESPGEPGRSSILQIFKKTSGGEVQHRSRKREREARSTAYRERSFYSARGLQTVVGEGGSRAGVCRLCKGWACASWMGGRSRTAVFGCGEMGRGRRRERERWLGPAVTHKARCAGLIVWRSPAHEARGFAATSLHVKATNAPGC